MPRRINRAISVPADVRLPAEVLLFREERAQRQADLAIYLKRLRKAIPGMTVRVAETYLVAAGVPLSSSHISRLESPAKMAAMENINLPVIWALVSIYNGSMEEVQRILYGRHPARSMLAQEALARHEKENGLIAAYRLLLEDGQETVWAITKALAQQQANHLLTSSLGASLSASSSSPPAPAGQAASRSVYDDAVADRVIEQRLADQERRMRDRLSRQAEEEEESQTPTRKHATDGPSS